MSSLAIRRAPHWLFMGAGLFSAASRAEPSAPPAPADAKRAYQQVLDLQPGSKLADGIQKKMALLP